MDGSLAPRSSSAAFDAYGGGGLMLLGTVFTCPSFTCASPLLADALFVGFEATGAYLIMAALAGAVHRLRPTAPSSSAATASASQR